MNYNSDVFLPNIMDWTDSWHFSDIVFFFCDR